MEEIMKFKSLLPCLLLAAACTLSPNSAQAATHLNLVSGAVSGKWYLNMGLIGKAIAAMYPDMEITMLPGAGRSNVIMADRGKADVTFSQAALTAAARDGISPYTSKVTRVCTLMNIQDPQNFNVLVRRVLGIDSIDQIREKKMPVRISTGPQGGNSEVYGRWLFEAYGISFEELETWGGKAFPSTMDGVIEAVQNNQADIVIWNGSGESWHIAEILKSMPFKALPISPEVAAKMEKEHGFRPALLPKEYYKGQIADADVPTICDWLEILVPASMPEETAYKITKAVAESLEFLSQGNPDWKKVTEDKMPQDFVLPMHPGAERYYRERGWIK